MLKKLNNGIIPIIVVKVNAIIEEKNDFKESLKNIEKNMLIEPHKNAPIKKEIKYLIDNSILNSLLKANIKGIKNIININKKIMKKTENVFIKNIFFLSIIFNKK